MATETTLAIIKPDAVHEGHLGKIIDRIYSAGFTISKLQMFELTELGAKTFYAEHEGRPYFDKLVRFMESGPLVALALEGEDAIARWRSEMKEIRATYASKEHSERNAVHGSDSPESAKRELDYFFYDWSW